MRSRWLPRAISALVALVVVARAPAWWCGRHADRFFDGDLDAERALGRGARAWLDAAPATLAFHTGSPRFDGEWYLIIHMAAVLGFSGTARAHPELAAEHGALALRALDRLLLPAGRAHDRDAWGEDPIDALDGDAGHLAFLGYANLALSTALPLDPPAAIRALNDRMTAAIARRFAARPGVLLESYPGETYPADNAAAVASLLVHDRACGPGTPRVAPPVIARALAAITIHSRDRATGLLYQRLDSNSGAPIDGPRASGTAMAAFVLGTADPKLARPLWDALARQWDTVLGFGGAREYPPGAAGRGDVDSGPVIAGLGVSATALSLAAARRAGDRARFRSAFASAWLFGLPVEKDGALRFASGGPLGDVLLFALLTAGPTS